MKIMFKNKSKKIKSLEEKVDNLVGMQKEVLDDFILILTQIQETNNEKMQWKHKQLVINNSIDLAIENYKKKIVELHIDPQY